MNRRTLFLGVVAAFIIFGRLGDGILANYDDCYYAEKAKEMLQSGDWLTPQFAGHVRLDNPPLFLWLIAAGFKLFGVDKLGAAFFTGLAGVCCVLALVRLARRLGYDTFEAWAAGVILLTTQYFLKYAQHAMMDVVLTLFFLLALDGYLSGVADRRGGWARLGLFTGLGVLMKSVLGLFPMIVVVLHRLAVRGRAAAGERRPWIALAVAGAVAAPWYAYQLSTHRDQLVSEHFMWLIVSRGLGEPGAEGIDNGPLGYLTRITTVYWPWLPFAAYGIWLEARRAFDRTQPDDTRGAARLLLIWLAVVLGVMSAAHVKKLWYVMSVFPCLALLASRATAALIRTEAARRRTMVITGSVLALLAVAIAFTPYGSSRERQPGLHAMARAACAAPSGRKVVNLDAPYWDVANLFLFYSDRDLTEPVGDPARVRDALAGGDWALIRASRLSDVLGGDAPSYEVAAREGDWTLVKATTSAGRRGS